MKTVLQELIDELESIKGYKYGGLVIRIMKDRLEREKEQIIDAFLNGKVNHNKDWSEEYYNKTYNQDRELSKEDKTFKRKSQWTKLNKKQQ